MCKIILQNETSSMVSRKNSEDIELTSQTTVYLVSNRSSQPLPSRSSFDRISQVIRLSVASLGSMLAKYYEAKRITTMANENLGRQNKYKKLATKKISLAILLICAGTGLLALFHFMHPFYATKKLETNNFVSKNLRF